MVNPVITGRTVFPILFSNAYTLQKNKKESMCTFTVVYQHIPEIKRYTGTAYNIAPLLRIRVLYFDVPLLSQQYNRYKVPWKGVLQALLHVRKRLHCYYIFLKLILHRVIIPECLLVNHSVCILQKGHYIKRGNTHSTLINILSFAFCLHIAHVSKGKVVFLSLTVLRSQSALLFLIILEVSCM